MQKIILSIFFFILLSPCAFCNDTLYIEDFLKVINDNHPLIKKADLFDVFSEAYKLKGKGALDPKLQSDYQRKKFDNTDYYTVWQSELKLPTKLPIDFSLGYENNEGQFLGNENNVPRQGLLYGTINLSIIRGLLFDDQRYQLQVAELYGLKSQIEKNILTREIIYQAINAYLEWAISFYNLEIYEDYFELINERHQNVIDLYLNGDSPAVDTLESKVNLITAEKSILEATEKLVSKTQKLNLFIWNEEGRPLVISDIVFPSNFEYLKNYLDQISIIDTPDFETDPKVRKIQNEIEILELSNRLEKEQLKPQLDLKYNTIANLGKDEFDPSLSLNDYKFGVAFEYPILNRKTKGELKLNNAIIAQNLFDKTQYTETLLNKYIELNQRQVIQLEILFVLGQKIENSQLLYEAESLKFELGESSVFLLNQRERKLLEAQTELIKGYLSIGKVLNDIYYLKLGQE